MKDEQKKNTSFICPNCASENIQSFPLVYKMGVNNINTTTSGVGVGIGLPLSAGIGIGGSTTNGVNKSLLAQQLAPPKKETYLLRAFFYWLLANIGLTIITGMLSTLVMNSADMPNGIELFCLWGYLLFYFCFPVYIAVRLTRSERRYNKYNYPKLLHKWYHSYICLRCGKTFIINDQ